MIIIDALDNDTLLTQIIVPQSKYFDNLQTKIRSA